MANVDVEMNIEPNHLISLDANNVLITGTDGRLKVPKGEIVAIPGPPGADGKDGTNGIDGAPGANGRDGVDGAPGTPGTNGTNGINGTDGQDGAPGRDGIDGANGVGIPTGGTAGQVLAKKSNENFDTEWVEPSGGGGGSSGVETIGVTDDEELLEMSGTPTNAKIESTQELRNAVKKANSAQQEPYSDEWVKKSFANLDNSLHSISGIVSDVALDLDFAIQELETINEKIPIQASSENQLADKDFVNSSIQNMAANFVTPDALGVEIWESLEALRSGPWFFEGVPYSPTQNDYATFFEEYDGREWRARFTGNLWSPDFPINNSGLTAEQTAVLNSGATEELINKLANPDNLPTENSAELVKSGGVFAWFGAALSALQTTAKTVIGAINELYNNKLNKSGGTMTGILNMGSQRISNLATPVANTDATPKSYVDAVLIGYPKSKYHDVLTSWSSLDQSSKLPNSDAYGTLEVPALATVELSIIARTSSTAGNRAAVGIAWQADGANTANFAPSFEGDAYQSIPKIMEEHNIVNGSAAVQTVSIHKFIKNPFNAKFYLYVKCYGASRYVMMLS